MKADKKILVAFILNAVFCVFEFLGGIFTGSVAIISDAVHDLGDAASIGISFFLEKKSRRQPDETYTYGYGRYSIIGSVITTAVLFVGSVIVAYKSVMRIAHPTQINYNGMLIFAMVGTVVNCSAAFFTRDGDSLNQKAVNLHMLEDTLGWIVVFVGAVVMKFTNFVIIDPLMSIGVSIFIVINALKNLKRALDVFLEKTPHGISVKQIKEHVCEIDGVKDVHHVHIWSMDGVNNYATMHVVADGDIHKTKEKIREELAEHNIGHVTLEMETDEEFCHEKNCLLDNNSISTHHHHHHH